MDMQSSTENNSKQQRRSARLAKQLQQQQQRQPKYVSDASNAMNKKKQYQKKQKRQNKEKTVVITSQPSEGACKQSNSKVAARRSTRARAVKEQKVETIARKSTNSTSKTRTKAIKYTDTKSKKEAKIKTAGTKRPITTKTTSHRNTKRRKLESPTTKTSKLTATEQMTTAMPPLLTLGKLVRGTLVRRPSASIRSPYVADVALSLNDSSNYNTSTSDADNDNIKSASNNDNIVLAHAPSLDVGGMCVAGSEVYMTQRKVTNNNNNTKTSHSIELVRFSSTKVARGDGDGDGGCKISSSKDTSDSNKVDNDHDDRNENVLIGVHPRLGEMVAYEVLKRGLLQEVIPLKEGLVVGPITNGDDTNEKDNNLKIELKKQVTIGDSRVDFEMTISDQRQQHQNKEKKKRSQEEASSHRVIFEVKNVVCADYHQGTEPTKMGPNHCVVVATPDSQSSPQCYDYRRKALFPWAKSRSQEFEGKKVASARALKHLRNLQSLLRSDQKIKQNKTGDGVDGNACITPVVLFVVNRSDCHSVRACDEACPVFKDVLEEVVRSGVMAVAVRVHWTEDGDCFFDGTVPVNI